MSTPPSSSFTSPMSTASISHASSVPRTVEELDRLRARIEPAAECWKPKRSGSSPSDTSLSEVSPHESGASSESPDASECAQLMPLQPSSRGESVISMSSSCSTSSPSQQEAHSSSLTATGRAWGSIAARVKSLASISMWRMWGRGSVGVERQPPSSMNACTGVAAPDASVSVGDAALLRLRFGSSASSAERFLDALSGEQASRFR
mmetsp:Transcript_30802/g.73176  ORF Transcript_30802/g.73176 Transcript_30802/m.73176 type:complete len:206 (+) Transcript_30802:710-1327(+)